MSANKMQEKCISPGLDRQVASVSVNDKGEKETIHLTRTAGPIILSRALGHRCCGIAQIRPFIAGASVYAIAPVRCQD